MLLAKSLDAGWRVELRCNDAALAQRLDGALWQGEGFLPHGLAGGPHDARQPVLLTVADAGGDGAAPPAAPPAPAANAPACVISLGGAAVAATEAAALARIAIVFDGRSAAAVDHARGQWRALTGAGVQAQYWAEDGGRWQRKA